MRTIIVAAALALSACSPNADKVCDHQLDLANNDPKRGVNEKRDRCLSGLRELEKKSSKQYACVAKCVLAAKLYDDVDTCHALCAPDGAALGGRATKASASASAKATSAPAAPTESEPTPAPAPTPVATHPPRAAPKPSTSAASSSKASASPTPKGSATPPVRRGK